MNEKFIKESQVSKGVEVLRVENKSMKEASRIVVKTFYVLTHCGQFIDERLLSQGLYATDVPTLYSKDTTIELMIQHGRRVIDMTGNKFIEEVYFDNLSKCTLKEVNLSILD